MQLKLNFVLLTFPFLLNSCNTQEKCLHKGGDTELTLQIEGENEGGVYYVEKRLSRDWEPLDTIELNEEGIAVCNVQLDHIEILSIKKAGQQGEILLIAGKGDKVSVRAKSEDLAGTFRLKGTSENEDLDAFIAYERTFQNYADSLNKVYLNLKRNNMHYGVEKEFNALYREKAIAHEQFVKSFLDSKPDRFVNLLAVRSLDIKRNPEYFEKVMHGLEKKFSESEHVVYFANDVKRVIASEVGGRAPEIILPSHKNEVVKLSDFKGKYVLIDFWATWCRPCIAEIPNLKAVYKKYQGDDFEIVSVCVDKSDFKGNWMKIIEENQMEWPQLFDATGVAAQDYGIEYFPTIFLLNKEGEVIARNIRGHQIDQKLSQVLQ